MTIPRQSLPLTGRVRTTDVSHSTPALFLTALRQLGDHDLTFTQLAAMVYLTVYPDARVSEVAATLRRSVAATGRLAAQLEHARLVKRTPSRDDGRVTLLRLTPAGRRFVALLHKRRTSGVRLSAETAAKLSHRERAVVTEALANLGRHGVVR